MALPSSSQVSLRSSTSAVAPTDRLHALDAARGAAMLFVCLSHFGNAYFRSFGDAAHDQLLSKVGMLASPTFLILSGAVLGWMYTACEGHAAALRRRFLDRGIFLLTVAHVLVVTAEIPRLGDAWGALHISLITDVIGVAMIVGPFVVMRSRAHPRLLLAGGLYLASMLVVLAWMPADAHLRFVKETLFGAAPGESGSWGYNVPFVPDFALYLAGTSLGQVIARCAARGDWVSVERLLWRLGALAAVAGAALRSLVIGAKHAGVLTDPAWVTSVDFLTSPWQKLPPSLGYVGVFGGAGMLLTAFMFTSVRVVWLQPLSRVVGVLGRASLFMWVLQFWVYYFTFTLLRLPYSPWWPLYFASTIALIYAAARWWDGHGWNRLLTLGLAEGQRFGSDAWRHGLRDLWRRVH